VPPLDPPHLTPPVSLNRVRLVDLPGLDIDPAVKGKTGYELVSSLALTVLIRAQIDALKLDPALDDSVLPLAFETCFCHTDESVRAAAESIARQIGRDLGYLLLVLHRGDPVNRAARAEWDDSYWAHWAGIRQVCLGGGLVSGALGPRLVTHARAVLTDAGIALHISPYAPVLPLVGAARLVPPDTTAALVFDFGHTLVKRAVGVYHDGALAELRLLPSVPTHFDNEAGDPADPASVARGVRDLMIGIMTDTWHAAQDSGHRLSSVIPASLSAYVRDGQPLAAQSGAYVQLLHITDNAARMLSDHLSATLDRPVTVMLIHDGTAAAAAHAGLENAAVITIGTALGIGFPPSRNDVQPAADHILLHKKGTQ
jgi:hypothetical protein